MAWLLSDGLSRSQKVEVKKRKYEQKNMTLQWSYSTSSPPELEDEDRDDANVQDNDPGLLSSSGSDTDTTNEEGETETDSDREAEEKSQITHPSPVITYREDIPAQTEPKTHGDLQICSILECGCEVMTCQFSNDGSLLAVGLADGCIKVYSTEKLELIQTLRDRNTFSSLPITGLRFRHTEQKHCTLLATYASGMVRCWYVWGGQCVWRVEETRDQGGSDGEVNRQTLCLSVSPSGERAVTGGSDSAIHLYDLNTHQRLQICKASSTRTVMDGHSLRVFAVTFHPDRETQFISGGWDNTMQFWDTRQQHAIRMISGPHVCGDGLDIDPSANQILSGSWRQCNTVEMWDYDSGKKVADVPQDSDANSRIYSCHWFGRDQIIAAGGHANMLRVIDRHSLTTVSKFFGLSSAIFSTSTCPCGKWAGLISATAGDRVFLLDRNQSPNVKRLFSTGVGVLK